MSHDVSEEIKQFLFSHIDSVEQLDTIALMRQHKEKWWTARAISEELRTSAASVSNRLKVLQGTGLIIASEDSTSFRYSPRTPELGRLIDDLAEIYKVRKHTVLQLIFSPMKRARNFADAFVITGSDNKKSEDENG